MNRAARIGILEGTLDPIHFGHLDTALAAREALALDRVVIIPLADSSAPRAPAVRVLTTASRWPPSLSTVNGVGGLSVSDVELLAPGPHTRQTRCCTTGRGWVSRHRRFSSSRGRMRLQIFKRGAGIRRVAGLAHFVVVSRP